MIRLPQSLIQTITGVHGQAGEIWVKNFDSLVAFCEQEWQLQLLEPFPLSFHFVTPVIQKDGSSAVLKLGVPSREWLTELAALRAFQGKGVCKLLAADEQKGIVLLEHIRPGTPLRFVTDDEQAVGLAVQVIQKMQTVPITDATIFPTIARWASGLARLRQYFEGTGPFPETMVQRAEKLYADLCAGIRHPRLLHGDLHQENILQAADGQWIAIDPKGLIGETEYELIPFLMNCLPEKDVPHVIRNRIRLFAKYLNLSEERITAWAFCHAVLSAWWCLEDKTGGELTAIQLARLFETLLDANE